MDEQIKYYEAKLSYEIDPADLFDALQQQEDVVIMDVRQEEGFKHEHIPGSINLPHKEITLETTRKWDQSKLYVCYCDGIGCNASTKGALNMRKLGFKVKELQGGLQWWKDDGYATEGAVPLAGSKKSECHC
jgi:rhodanese-related sulfurtransferase